MESYEPMENSLLEYASFPVHVTLELYDMEDPSRGWEGIKPNYAQNIVMGKWEMGKERKKRQNVYRVSEYLCNFVCVF
jgi:hypothetical protein